jgi:hypothetical protein
MRKMEEGRRELRKSKLEGKKKEMKEIEEET